MSIGKKDRFEVFKRDGFTIQKRIDKQIEEVNAVYSSWFEGYELIESFKQSTIRNFIKQLGVEETKESMRLACSQIKDPNRSIRYFCGICWNKIKTDKL